MATKALPFEGKPLGAARAILYGALVVGVLDAIDAIVFFGLRGVSPIRCFQAVASGRLAVLARRPILCGLLYGVFVYFFMNHVVIPLSAVTRGGTFSLPVFLNGIIGHAFLVGVPSAVFARLGRGESLGP
jgi:hypothetical protein